MMKNTFLKLCVISFLMVLMVFYVPKDIYALETNSEISEEEIIEDACRNALGAIYLLKDENMDAYIGNLYNVVDDSGELTGYSLGYFVNNVPYGYAIYSIESGTIREFVFEENVENLYIEIVEEFVNKTNIESDNIAKGLISENVVDYSVINIDGTTFANDGSISKLSTRQSETIINNLDNYDESILQTNDDDDIMLCSTKHNVYYYCDQIKPQDLPKKGSETYAEVPNYGLTMYGQNYVLDNVGRYCCIISAATGIINWTGLLKDNNLETTYLDLWDRCKTSWTNQPYGGATVSNVINGMNSYFQENNSSIRIYSKTNPSFYDFISWISGFDSDNKRPVMLALNGDDWEIGHTVVVVSTYSTTNVGNSVYDDYLGIYNTWENWNGTVGSGALNGIRYLNYNELISDSGVIRTAMYGNNIKPIDCINNYSTRDGFSIKCVVPYGTKYVYYPTWTTYNGQDDIVWHLGTINGRKSQVFVNVPDHNYEGGNYATHIYAYDANMNLLSSYGTVYNNVDMSITNVSVSSITDDGFTISCSFPPGTAYVKMPTWTTYNGQDDVRWYDATMYQTRALRRVYYSDHNNEKGLYNVHIYAYNASGKVLASYAYNGINIK